MSARLEVTPMPVGVRRSWMDVRVVAKGRDEMGRSTQVLPLLLLLIAACHSAPPAVVRLPPPVETYALGPGDVVEVQVYEDPTLSKTFKVAPDGTIDFPLLGTMNVAGKEPQELAEFLRTRLKQDRILKNPSLSVFVKEVNSKKFSVYGQVAKPGQYAMNENMTVVQAVIIAGGFTQIADRDRVTLTRKVGKTKVVRVVLSVAAMTEGRTNDIPLQAGDTIYVEERVF